MHLADGEIVEVEAQIRRHIGIRRLFMRQDDVEPDRLSPGLVGAAVARLHHARAAAGADHPFPPVSRHRAFRHHPREGPRLVVIAAEFGQNRGFRRVLARRFRDAGAAEQHHRAFHAAFIHDQLRLEQFQLQPHRAQFLAHHEAAIGESELVGGRPRLCGGGDVLRRFCIHDAVTERVGTAFVFHILLIARGAFPNYRGKTMNAT